jgi:hypothetical protein
MAQYFSLTKKGETRITKLQAVDAEICIYLEIECDPVVWCNNWYNEVGFALACGKSLDWCRENLPHQEKIIDFIERYYDVDAWSGR